MLNTTIQKATIACYVKSMPGRGAYVQDIYVRDVVAEQVKECITVNANFKNPAPKPTPARPTDFRRLSFENVLCRSLPADSRAINLAGRPSYPLRGLRLADVSVLSEVLNSLARRYRTIEITHEARVDARRTACARVPDFEYVLADDERVPQ